SAVSAGGRGNVSTAQSERELANSLEKALQWVLPDLEEVCDGQDNDCDDSIDEGFFRYFYTSPTGTLGIGACHAGRIDCVEGRSEII
ncbi:putative metal-binding motif-containing protein, partial [Bifidobacterium longum]|nr:putative metal-binding motif-containing protein [Bifidobacterium longum]